MIYKCVTYEIQLQIKFRLKSYSLEINQRINLINENSFEIINVEIWVTKHKWTIRNTNKRSTDYKQKVKSEKRDGWPGVLNTNHVIESAIVIGRL